MNPQKSTLQRGFTFIELTTVLAIIGILAAIAVPNAGVFRDRAYMAAPWIQCYSLRQTLEEHYSWHGSFPKDNKQAGLPEAEILATQYLSSITIEDGVLHMVWGNRAPTSRHGKTVIIRPKVSQAGSNTVITWEEDLSQ